MKAPIGQSRLSEPRSAEPGSLPVEPDQGPVPALNPDEREEGPIDRQTITRHPGLE